MRNTGTIASDIVLTFAFFAMILFIFRPWPLRRASKMHSLGIRTYLPDGQSRASLTHKLEPIEEPPYRCRCPDCGERFKRLNSTLVKRGLHEAVACQETNRRYHGSSVRRGGHWILTFTCPTCARVGKSDRNYLVGQRKIMCDGVKFTKVDK
jgi:hypothetical protein